MRNESVVWGFILVLLGGLLLAQNMGWLPANVNVWALIWPLVLVGMGLRMLQRSTRRGSSIEAEALRLPLDGAQSARISMHHGAGELRVDDQAGPDELLSGSFGGGIEQRVSRSGSEALVDLRVPSGNIPGMLPFAGDTLNWTVGLNPNVPLTIIMEVGASRNLLNLRNLQVRELHLQTGASSTEIDLPAHAGQTRATIRCGAASVELRVPPSVAARIHAGGGLASIHVDPLRFLRDASVAGSGSGGATVGGGDFRSPDYDTAENRIDLDIETGIGSVSIR